MLSWAKLHCQEAEPKGSEQRKRQRQQTRLPRFDDHAEADVVDFPPCRAFPAKAGRTRMGLARTGANAICALVPLP